MVFAIALAAFLVWRRRRLEPTLVAGGALVAVGAFVYSLGVVHFPDLEQLLIDVGERLGKWTYVLVGALAFLETGAFIGLIAPGETALLLGGLVAGQGQVDVLTMIAVVWACAVAGDLTSFFLGRRLGRAFMVKHGAKVQITEARLEQVERFFDRHGGKAILIGRFVGLVRAVAPFMAGSSGMPLRRFVPYDVIGAGLWGSTFVVLGYVFWQSFSQLVDYAKKGALALGAVIVLVVAIVWLVRWVRDPDNRERMREWMERQAQRPALRPLVRVLAPLLRTTRRPARFVWDRVTPGDLGLEFTTLFAVAGVGAFVFVWDLVRIEQDNGLLAGDAGSLRLADRLHMDMLVDVAKVVTRAGLTARRDRARGPRGGDARVAPHAPRRPGARRRSRAHLRGGAHHQGRRRPPAACTRARRRRQRCLSVGPRSLRRDVDRGRRRAQPRAAQRRLALRLRHRGDRDRGRGRPVSDLPARPLPLRRGRRVGAGRSDLRPVRQRRAGHRLRAEQCTGARRHPLMSNESIIYLVAACSGVFGLAAYVGLIVVPAWTAYSRIWERLAATVLTLYVLAGFLILGVVGGAAVIWFWDRITA